MPYYPSPPIAYAPSDDGAQALVALPPVDLKKNRPTTQQQLVDTRRIPERNQKQQPIGGYDDDYEEEDDYIPNEGYLGHAGYRKRPQSPLVSGIKENIKKEVHKKVPTYSKPETTSEEENSVRFPDEKNSDEKYENEKDDEEDDDVSEEVIFPQDEEKAYRNEANYNRNHDVDHVYPVPKNTRDQILINTQNNRNRNSEKESYNSPNQNIFQPQNVPKNSYSQLENIPKNSYSQPQRNNDPPRYHESQQNVYTPGIQSPEKLLKNIDRNNYPRVQAAKLPTVREILEEVSRFPQRKPNQEYLEAHRKTKENKNQQYPDIQQYYSLGGQQIYGQRGQRDGVRNSQQTRNLPPQHIQVDPRLHQPGSVGNVTPLQHAPQTQQTVRGTNAHEQLQLHRQLEQLAQQQNLRNNQQQISRGITPLEQLQQQQTKPPFSPVVLLSRGPPSQDHAVDVWYARQ